MATNLDEHVQYPYLSGSSKLYMTVLRVRQHSGLCDPAGNVHSWVRTTNKLTPRYMAHFWASFDITNLTHFTFTELALLYQPMRSLHCRRTPPQRRTPMVSDPRPIWGTPSD